VPGGQAADPVFSIPLEDPVESLNVSVAAAVFLFEAARQRSVCRDTACRDR